MEGTQVTEGALLLSILPHILSLVARNLRRVPLQLSRVLMCVQLCIARSVCHSWYTAEEELIDTDKLSLYCKIWITQPISLLLLIVKGARDSRSEKLLSCATSLFEFSFSQEFPFMPLLPWNSLGWGGNVQEWLVFSDYAPESNLIPTFVIVLFFKKIVFVFLSDPSPIIGYACQ